MCLFVSFTFCDSRLIIALSFSSLFTSLSLSLSFRLFLSLSLYVYLYLSLSLCLSISCQSLAPLLFPLLYFHRSPFCVSVKNTLIIVYYHSPPYHHVMLSPPSCRLSSPLYYACTLFAHIIRTHDIAEKDEIRLAILRSYDRGVSKCVFGLKAFAQFNGGCFYPNLVEIVYGLP